MLADTGFKLAAMRRGDHWRLSENERNELGLNLMRCVKTLPMIPEDKLGKFAPWLGLGMCAYAIVVPRAERDAAMRALPNGSDPRVGPAAFERVNVDMLPADVQQAVRDGRVEVRTMTPEEYAAMVRDGGEPDWPTLGATDETLLTRVIDATQGVDQGSLAEAARSAGRLTD